MMHRRGKDPGNQGLLVRNGLHELNLRSFPVGKPPDMETRFEDLPRINRAASRWPYPLKTESKEVAVAGRILLEAKAFLEGGISSISRRLQQKDLLELRKRTNELERAFDSDVSPETLERLGNAVLALIPEIKR